MDGKLPLWRKLAGVTVYIIAALAACLALLMLAGCYRWLTFGWNHGPTIDMPSLSLVLFGGASVSAAASLILFWLGRLICR